MGNVAGFCVKCGSPHEAGQAFCMKCGASVGGAAPAAQATPTASPAAPVTPTPTPRPVTPAAAPVAASPAAAAPVAKKGGGGTLVKVLLVLGVFFILIVGAAIAGVWYVGHRVKEKIASLGLNDTSSSDRSVAGGSTANVNLCSVLSMAEVSQATSAEVVRAEAPTDGNAGCVYSVKGDAADLAAKHASHLMGSMGADKNSQAMGEQFGKTMFHAQEGQEQTSSSDHPGEVPVLSFSVDTTGAKAQYELNKKGLGMLGPVGSVDLPGVGDEAFSSSGGMIFVRKGNKLIRMMFLMCPCTTNDVVPLAKKIADSQ